MQRPVATFSIVGLDPATEELGVAVQSKFLAVGSVVSWARAGVGAVATQAHANPAYGPEGLDLMASGGSAREVVETLTGKDEGRSHRQVGVVDARGNAAAFTGEDCFDWAGDATGDYYTVQGNILVGEETVGEMGRAFVETTGSLADRLLASLAAGQRAGGDSRGRQSAALLVVRENGGYGGRNDRALDLRVDDHPEPIEELLRIRSLHELYFGEVKPEDVVKLDGRAREDVASILRGLGYLRTGHPAGDGELYHALGAFIRTENFEEREQERGYIDLEVLRALQSRR